MRTCIIRFSRPKSEVFKFKMSLLVSRAFRLTQTLPVVRKLVR